MDRYKVWFAGRKCSTERIEANCVYPGRLPSICKSECGTPEFQWFVISIQWDELC